MKFVRNKYHYAVRRKKKQAESIRAKELFEQAKLGDINLLKEMKRIKGDKKQFAACPDNIDTAHGVEEVSELFKSVYEDLYNSAESIEEMKTIKIRLKQLIGPESIEEVLKITGATVKEACCRMEFQFNFNLCISEPKIQVIQLSHII